MRLPIITLSIVSLTACGSAFDTTNGTGLFGLGAGNEVTGGNTTPDAGAGADDDADSESDSDGHDGDCSGECKFDRYNLDVRVGDAFVVTNFVTCADPLAAHSFEMDGGDWSQLDIITTSTNSTAGVGGIFIFAWQPASSTFSDNVYFGPATTPAFNVATDIEVALATDIDGDGHIDILMTDTGSPRPPVILHGNGPGTFDTAYVDTPAVAAGGFVNSFLPMDLNADGRLDLVMGYQDDISNSNLSIGLQNSDGTFAPSDFSQVGDIGIRAAIDFDEDGTLDTLDGGAVLRGLGDGKFELTFPLPPGSGADTAIDLDGDGFLDVGGVTDASTDGASAIGIAWGTGPATFEPSLDKFPIPVTLSRSASGNLDGQRGIDFAVDGYREAGLTVLLSRCAP